MDQSVLTVDWYPFHIAKCAVTPHWTPLSIHPLCCCYTPVCFHTECWISAFWRVRFKKRSKIEQKDIITPMHCLAFPSALFGAPFHIDNRTVGNCGFWLEYASKTPLEVGADLPRRMRLFWLRCQIMRLRSIHIKPHYSQNAFDSALLAWYERGMRVLVEFGPWEHLWSCLPSMMSNLRVWEWHTRSSNSSQKGGATDISKQAKNNQTLPKSHFFVVLAFFSCSQDKKAIFPHWIHRNLYQNSGKCWKLKM